MFGWYNRYVYRRISTRFDKNERKFLIEKIINNKISNNIKDKYLKMKEMLIKGEVKTDRLYQHPYAFCLYYNKQVYNYKQEAWR